MTAVQMKIPEKLTEFLAAEAASRGCSPRQMTLAILHCVKEAGLTDAVLDGADPAQLFAAGSGRKLTADLTPFQARVLGIIARARIDNGLGVISLTEIGERAGRARGQARNTVAALVAKGMVEVAETGSSWRPSRYRLTDKAEALLAATRDAARTARRAA